MLQPFDPSRWPRHAAMVLALAACLLATGCGRTGGRHFSLDQELARQSFTAFLDAWKQGQRLEDLKTRSPAIIAGDEDWSAGKKLVGYAVSPQEFNDGTNLHLTAELHLGNGKKSKAGKTAVSYVVGTSPVVTIFRK